MFQDLIDMLLNKKAEVMQTLDKIDSMLKQCGYEEPKVEVEETITEEMPSGYQETMI